MKELDEAYFDLDVLAERCWQSQRMISSYARVFLDLSVQSNVVGVPVNVRIPPMPSASHELMCDLSFVQSRSSRDLPDAVKQVRLTEVRKTISGFENLHRELSKLSYSLQCAHADHMANLWKVGYTIKNGSVVPL